MEWNKILLKKIYKAEKDREYYEKNSERIKERQRKYNARPEVIQRRKNEYNNIIKCNKCNKNVKAGAYKYHIEKKCKPPLLELILLEGDPTTGEITKKYIYSNHD